MPYNAHGATISGSASNVTDALGVILGNTFFVGSGKSIDITNAYVTGGRIWTSGLFAANVQVNIRLYEVPVGDYVHPFVGRSPVRNKTVTVNTSGWTNAIWDEPWKIPDYGTPWVIGYRFVTDPTRIIVNSGFRASDIDYAADTTHGLVLSKSLGLKPGVAAFRHGWYLYDNNFSGFTTTATTSYGADSIVDIIAPTPTGPQWSIWNGTAEVPATAKIWTGSSEANISDITIT
jgi:hypothetical protein